MSVIDKLQSLNLSEDAVLTLTYSEGTDVFHFNETHIDDAMSETDVLSAFSDLISDTKLDARNRWSGNVIQHLREEGFLEDYQRDGTFSEYLLETLQENFYDVELIEHSTEKYDHKRGFTTLTAEVEVPYANFINNIPWGLNLWTVSVSTEAGTLTLNG